MFGNNQDDKLYEGVWKIEGVTPTKNGDEVVVEYKTGWFRNPFEEREQNVTPEDYGPKGDSVQAVRLPIEVIPKVEGDKNESVQIIHELEKRLDLQESTYEDAF